MNIITKKNATVKLKNGANNTYNVVVIYLNISKLSVLDKIMLKALF